jgi:hypothetical protein
LETTKDIQMDRRFLSAFIIFLLCGLPVMSQAASGDLDASFNNTGKLITRGAVDGGLQKSFSKRMES